MPERCAGQNLVASENLPEGEGFRAIKGFLMNFCPFLIKDINFLPDAVQPCCNIRSLGAVPRFPFSGGAVDMPAYSEHIRRTMVLLQKNSGMCAGCPELRKIDRESLELRILFHTVSINMHTVCNCRCIYCNFWKNKKPPASYSILPVLKSLQNSNVLHPQCFFSWGGGESTVLKEFDETCDWLSHHTGFYQYVHTNALRYAHGLSAILEKEAGGVNISLDSGSAEVYKNVKGRDAFATVTENIKKYLYAAKNKNSVDIKYIIFAANNNTQEIEKFFALCREIGIKSVQFSFNFSEVNKKELDAETVKCAVLFIKRASELDMLCSPFFVDSRILRILASVLDGENRVPSNGEQSWRL